MILVFLPFNILGFSFLTLFEFENALVIFVSNLIFIFAYLALNKFNLYINTNQFIDSQDAAIHQYNEEK